MIANIAGGAIIKITCLLIAGLVLDGLMRRKWVLAAAAMWNATLLAILILPVAMLLLPQFRVPLLPSRSRAAPSRSTAIDIPKLTDDRPPGISPTVKQSIDDEDTDNTAPLSGESGTSVAIVKYTIPTALAWIYAVGTAFVAMRLAASWWAVVRLKRGAEQVANVLWIERLCFWETRLHLPSECEKKRQSRQVFPTIRASLFWPVQLLQSDEIDVPVALGVWRRTIIIPVCLATEKSRELVDAILVHELAHIVRADCSWQWVQRVVEAAWWFHPLIWLVRRRIAFIRERACDDFAVHSLGDVGAYSNSLLAIASGPTRAGSLGLGMAVVRRGSLARRLEAIQRTQGVNRCYASSVVRGSCTLATLCSTFLLACVVVDRASADPSIAQITGSSSEAEEPIKANENAVKGIPPTSVERPAGTTNPDNVQGKFADDTDVKPDESADEIQAGLLKEAMEGFEKARQSIVPYDVNMTVTLTIPMKTILVDTKEPDHPNITKTMQWRPLEPGEEPKTRTNSFRQVLSHDGRRRVETDGGNAEQFTVSRGKSVIVDDGKTQRILGTLSVVGTVEGNIRRSGDYRLQTGDEYSTYFRDLLGVVPLQLLVKERPGTRIIESKERDANLVGVLLPAGDGPSLKQFEFRVWLDRRYGFLPSKIEIYRRDGTETRLNNQMEVDKFHQFQPGRWAPIEMTYTAYNVQPGPYQGKVVNVYRVTVDVDRSRWNADLGDELFLLPYPAGIRVMDFINSLEIIAGEGDDGQDLQQLINGAARTKPVITPATVRRQQLDVAKVRQEDRDAATALVKYGATLKADKDGAITNVDFLVFRRDAPGLSGPNIDDAGLQHVAKLTKLEHLGLSNTQITDAGLVQLRALRTLKILSLSNTNITDEGVKQLETLTNLEWLFLDNHILQDGKRIRYVKITDEALRHLQPLQKLTHLQLYGTAITDAGLDHLKALPNLTQLSLDGSDVTRKGAEKLREARPGLRVLLD